MIYNLEVAFIKTFRPLYYQVVIFNDEQKSALFPANWNFYGLNRQTSAYSAIHCIDWAKIIKANVGKKIDSKNSSCLKVDAEIDEKNYVIFVLSSYKDEHDSDKHLRQTRATERWFAQNTEKISESM